ncbi:hypothetical protein SSBR45G_61690 [Bradyrhizobium sp. SSBR45G]|uniref:hypothetical protein n=1 Tax=unclassified Bradyrhizobium TaxID=2631580 RepID=UPI002342AE3D|nr:MULTISPECIES: hypothetical protein [unclassified Bradyrhizobium]GLH81260.1 hypothetical protein SSBR45G_61690 [Bradyrhizobium sp. SSBR45G]GLH88720.1 hypothetical protein SSBR45R_61810 [Bradyrhizobium sp. SSBR45R]
MTKESLGSLPLGNLFLGNLFKEKCVAAGLTNRSAHGLRKAAATVAAENGTTEAELDAIFGWNRSPEGKPFHAKNQPQETRVWRRCEARTNDQIHGPWSERLCPHRQARRRKSSQKLKRIRRRSEEWWARQGSNL